MTASRVLGALTSTNTSRAQHQSFQDTLIPFIQSAQIIDVLLGDDERVTAAEREDVQERNGFFIFVYFVTWL